ncbi:MAG: 30S ribosomal protein S13 [bacterium]
MSPIRISGVNLPDKKRAVIALTSIYGVGRPLAAAILRELKISEDVKASELTSEEERKLRDYIESNVVVEGDLRREIMQNVKRYKDISSYRGIRHARNLPVRGQRTRTNSRTVRGNVRKTAGSGRRSSSEKT